MARTKQKQNESLYIDVNAPIGSVPPVANISNSIAIGNTASANGFASTSIGKDTITSGSNAVALGVGSQCGSSGSIAIGFQSIATTGNRAIAIGSNNMAYGIDSVVMGVGSLSESSATASMAIGQGARVRAAAGVAIGDNAEVDTGATNAVQIGNGTNDTINTMQYLNNTIASSNGIVAGSTSGAPAGAGVTNEIRFDPAGPILYIYDGSTWRSTTLT